MNDARPGRRAAGVARTRATIVAAARRHLIDFGYHRLSLEQVADDAGITRVTIYRRFGSKLGLLEAIADDLADRSGVASAMAAAAAINEAPSAFRAMVTGLCRFWSTDPDLLRRLVSLSAVDPTAQNLIDDREAWRYRQVGIVVRRLAEEDRLRPPFTAPDRATAVVGAVTSFPTCDDLADHLGVRLDDLDEPLISVLSGVVRLD